MTRRLSLWLLLSAAVHAGLVALVALRIGVVPPPLPMLFVDLVQGFLAGGGPAPGAAGAGSHEKPATVSGGPAPTASDRREPRPSAPARSRAASGRRASAAGEKPAAAPATSGPITSPARPVPLDRALPTEPPSPAAAPGPLALREPPPAPRSAPVEPSRAVAEPAGSSTVASAPDGGDRHEGAPRAGDHGGIGSSGAAGSGGGIAGSGAGSAATGGGRGAAGDAAGLGLGAREGSVLALAIPGDGSGIGGEYQGYARLLGRRVQEALVYPPAALRRKLTGSVDLRVTVDATGAITDVALATSSTHRMLDEAAVHAAREVGRVPFPPDLAPRPLRIPVPVRFDVRVVR